MLQLIRSRLRGMQAWHRRGCLARYVLARLLAATRLCRLLVIRRAGYVLRFHPSALATTLWACPSDREEDHHVFQTLLRKGDQAIDVGANIGDLTLHAARLVGPGGRVYAIEPHPRTFRFLEENVSINAAGNVVLLNVALGAENGWGSLSDERSDDQNAVVPNSSVAGPLSVPLRRLDALDISDPIRLLKIDVEGYEKFVLEGATGLLARVEAIYFEALDANFRRFGYSVRDLLSWLEEHSFRICVLTETSGIEPLANVHDATHCANLLALQPAVYEQCRQVEAS